MRYTIVGDDGTMLVLTAGLDDVIAAAEERAAATGKVQRVFAPGSNEPVHVAGEP